MLSKYNESLCTENSSDDSDSDNEGSKKLYKHHRKESLIDKFLRWVVISPENMFFHFWKIFVLLLSIASSILYAIFAAFRTDVDYIGYIVYSEEHNFGLEIMHHVTIEE